MSSFRTLSRALFACACIFSLATGLRAQTYTPVPYNFPAAPDSVVPSSYSDGPRPYNETVEAMAANGYGLWLSGTDAASGTPVWKLSGNGLGKEQTLNNPVMPNGIIASGSDYHGDSGTCGASDTKVARNLLGSVRYVTLNSTYDGFIVSGFNDARVGGPVASHNISVAIPYNNGNDNLLNDTSIRKVITGPEYVYPLVSTQVTGEPGYPVQMEPVNDERCPVPLDWDIAMDGHYLYIVWYHFEYPDSCWTGEEIFLTCVNLSDGSVPLGYPVKLHTRNCGVPGGDGMTQPTVACDVRVNTLPSNGIFYPTCEVAYIDDFGSVHHLTVNGGGIVVNEYIPSYVMIPTDSTDYYPYHYRLVDLAPAVRARIMVASSRNDSGAWEPGGTGMQKDVIGYYVIANTQTSLYFFEEVNGTFPIMGDSTYGWFVDGPINSPSIPEEAFPIRGRSQTVTYGPSTQITAFANPYDGQNTGDYDEFHCVYQITSGSNEGLMIARGADNGVAWPTSPIPYQKDTRTVINQANNTLPLLPHNSDDYCAAVNQAGIHIRWGGGSNEYYSRDRRSYDEPIEEPTIMTYDNYVADGRGHNGTLGAQTQPGKNVLMWTDPILFSSAPTAANHAWLYFGNAGTDSNAIAAGLTIGTTTATDTLAKLIVFPSSGGTFQSPPIDSNRNFIQIGLSGSCDFYGGNFTAGGDFKLDSSTLNIMPGCNFAMTNQDTTGFPQLISSYGTIVSENGIGLDHNPQDNGSITIDGAISWNRTSLSCSAVPVTGLLDLLTLNGETKCPFASSVDSSSITNNAINGQALIYLHDPLDEVDIENSSINKIGLYGYWKLHTTSPIPSRPLFVESCTFDSIPMAVMTPAAIHLVRDVSTPDTVVDYNFVLDDNNFKHFTTDSSDGILLEDFLPNIPGDLGRYGTPIDISGNNFTTASSFGNTNKVEAAIHLRNTSAVLANDTINGERTDGTSTYAYGILLDPSARLDGGPSNSKIANTLICSNVISHVGYGPVTSGGVTTETGAGIATSYWTGYEKMNDISHSAQGSIFGINDKGAYLVDSIHDNQGPGINNNADFLNGVIYGIEMRGLIHPDHSGDMAGYNVVKNNNLDRTDSSGEVVASKGVTFNIGNEKGTGSTSVVYGMNSFVDNGSTDRLFWCTNSTNVFDWAHIGLGNGGALNNNYYQVGGSPYAPSSYSTSSTSESPEFEGIYYDNTADTTTPSFLGSVPANPGIACYGSRDITKKGGNQPTDLSADTASVAECSYMDNEDGILERAGDYEQAYDTAKAYLTLCYNLPDAWGMFSGATDDAGRLLIFNEYREWLKSVLYLRTDSMWYCADVYAMLSTFDDYPGHGVYGAGDVAIERYILEHQRCSSEWNAKFAQDLASWPNAMYNVWRDTVQDSFTEPYPDTTVPSIDDIGLSILRGMPASVAPSPLPAGDVHINGLYATENPFTNTTAIKFTLADYGLVTFQLFDVLGHAVTTNGIGQVLYPGEHEFDIDGSKLPNGNYIARVAFHNGDVESIIVERK
ncbi:MAG TPA: hypothetical protein VFH95_02540 [Candidatus Kapabacteria bacterium]|nr:hypothetical protein [Candidatus Kapabacteria bacterium]